MKLQYKPNSLLLRAAATVVGLLLSFFGAPDLRASDNPEFGQLSMTDGLTHYSVMAVYQDERDLVWIGTRSGLDLYDGTHLRHFRHIPGDPNTPASNNIRAISGDGQGHIYILTISGISIYDIGSDRFINVPATQSNAIAFGGGRLFFSSGHKLATLNPDGKIKPFKTATDIPSEITALCVADSALYIGTDGSGLLRCDLQGGKLSTLIPDGHITCIFADGGQIWAGTQSDGLHMIDSKGIRRQFRHRTDDSLSLGSDFVRSICRDKGGRLWIGTSEGLSRYSGHDDKFDNYLTGNGSTLPRHASGHASVWSLVCDRQGTVWIGTYFNGLLYYNPDNDMFSAYRPDNEGNGLSFPVTGEMADDANGQLWIATEGGGLNRLNPATGHIDRYIQPGGNNNIKALKYDSARNCLWLGTHLGGLKRYDLASGQYSDYPLGNDKANIVCDIEQQGANTLLLATHDGVFSFDIARGKFTPMLRSGKEGYKIALALDLALDHAGTLWIGGAEGGLYSYNFSTRKMERYAHDDKNDSSLGSDGINFLYVSPANELWVGTSDAGLDRFDRERKSFIHHTLANGSLPSDCVFGARQLPDGRLLILTDKALAILDGTRSTAYPIGGSVPLSAFNNKAIHLSSDAHYAYAGGIDGMVAFRPDDLRPRPADYSIFPMRLVVDGKEINADDGSGILRGSMATEGTITLDASHNFFTLYYALTDYTHDSELSPQYRLEGYSDSWQSLGPDRGISFTKLAPGNYRLHVRASDDEGAPESIIDIKVLPPLYLRWWAILAYTLVASALIWWAVRSYRRRIEVRNAIEIERRRSHDIEELNQDKLRFFTNVSNEFRTPLGLIIGKLEALMRSPEMPAQLLNKLNGTYANCILLRNMIAELLDFRRYEQGGMQIHVSEQNIVKFLGEIFVLFRDYASDKEIRFRFNKSNDSIMLMFDPTQLRKVVNNLLSNAFKHTGAGGEITLSVRHGDGSVVIEVSDTGSGIAPEDIDRIFNRFYQGKGSSAGDWQGIGVGLALAKGIVELHHGSIKVFSTPGHSTTFTVTLPTGNSHFSDEQMNGSDDYRQAEEFNVRHIIAETPASDSESQTAEAADSMTLRDGTIVIAQNNPQLREMLDDIFRPYFRVVSTGDGAEALRMIEENPPRLIVSGYSLSSLSGVDLCRRIRTQPSTAAVPFVFVSSHSADHEVLEGLTAGADDYLTLPFDVRQLLARCRNLISKHRLIDERPVRSAATTDATEPMLVSNGADIAFMRRAVEVVEEHLAESDFSIATFASQMNVSRTSLFARLKSITGQTPNDFILSIKMKHAEEMLRNSDEAYIADISYSLGFSSPRYFSRLFKERYKRSPREFRTEVRNR